MNLLKATIIGITTAGILVTAPTATSNDAYWGIGATSFDYEESGADLSVMTLDGKLGTYFNENFSGEIRLGLGVKDDTFSGVNFDLKNYYGAYVRGGVEASESVYPYIIAGYTRGKAEASFSGFSESASESDFSYGIGADFELSESLDFTVEYMNYLDKDGVELNGISLGFTFGL